MTTLKSPIVFTANRLLDGEAVWLGKNERWVRSVELARVFHTEEARNTGLKIAQRADTENVIVEPYEIDIALEDGVPVPTKFRERIRASGPTVRLDLGKQAQRDLPIFHAA